MNVDLSKCVDSLPTHFKSISGAGAVVSLVSYGNVYCFIICESYTHDDVKSSSTLTFTISLYFLSFVTIFFHFAIKSPSI
jgi:hypothetical protein